MTDQTKLRDAVARAIDPSAFTPSAHDKKALVDNAFRAAQRVLSLPEIADALKREEDTAILDWMERNGAEVNVDDGAGDGPGFVDVSYFRGNRNDRVKHGGRGHDLRAACRAAMRGGDKK